ncbi:hlyd family secretion protein [hydrocarbon metagenome]|uniref:Hlyd family secretion protein n=1 Tax=hydrocarbon metagenome TaxID=938273 RepID=A0A0W8E434_9ZZZZ
MHAKKPVIIMVVLVIIGLASYWTYYHYYRPPQNRIEASGTIEAESVELNVRISATLIRMAGEEGDSVSKGQLVAELSRSDLLAQRERDALSVTALEAKLDDLLSGARSQEIKEASSNVSITSASLQQLDLDLERTTRLYEAGAVSEAELQQLQLNRNNLAYQLDAAEARLSLLQAGNRPGVIEAATAELERSKAVLKAADAQLEDLQIVSPINGVISSKNYAVGEYVQVGSSLARITDLQDMWIKVYIPTDDLPNIKLKQKASVYVSGSDKTFTATVISISSQGEFTPKTIQTKKERTNIVYAVKLALDNEAGLLKPGMPADVIFDRSDSDA